MNGEQSPAADEKSYFILAVRVFVQEFLPKGLLIRMIRVHADDVVSLVTAFGDEPVDFRLVCRNDRVVIRIVGEIAISLPALKTNAGRAQFTLDYVHIFCSENRIISVRFRIDS